MVGSTEASIAVTLLARHTRSRPLFTIGLSEANSASLAAELRGHVGRRGLLGLTSDSIVTKAFAIYAANLLATEVRSLEWRPLLESLDVGSSELGSYIQLYDPLEASLSSLGRAVIMRRGRRRFLGTLLREGGLPAYVGDVAQLIAAKVRVTGWAAVLDEDTREWLVSAVAQHATGAARELLQGEEARFALGEFLLDAARTFHELSAKNIDPTSLDDAAAVERSVRQSGIELPSVRNSSLLLAVLGTFRERPPVTASLHPRLRVIATEHMGGVSVRTRADLGLLDGLVGLPSQVNLVTLAATPSPRPARLVRRSDRGWSEHTSDATRLEWTRSALIGPTLLVARWTSGAGETCVAEVASVEAPSNEMLWYGVDGEPVSGELEELSSGTQLVLLAPTPCAVAPTGEVEVTALEPPLGIGTAFSVRVRGMGSLRIDQGDATRTIECGAPPLPVEVLAPVSPAWATSRTVTTRLPDLLLPDGVQADLLARWPGVAQPATIARALRGRVVPSMYPALRERCGRVRLSLVSVSGQRWAASWFVLPRRFGIEVDDRVVTVRHSTEVHVASPHRVERSPGLTRITTAADDERCQLLLSTDSGETVSIFVQVPSEPLRLHRAAAVASETVVGAVLNEREVLEGALLELYGTAGTRLVVSTARDGALIEATQPASGRVRVPILEMLRRVTDCVSPVRLQAVVTQGATERAYSFSVIVPRMARPRFQFKTSRLEVEAVVDPADLPSAPGVALFDVARPLAPPTLLPAVTFTTDADRARLEIVDDGAIARGQHIAFVVDTSVSPPRAISGGVLVVASPAQTEPPIDLDALERAAWRGDQDAMSQAFDALAGSAELPALLDTVIDAVDRCAPYQLRWFFVFRVLATRCPWMLLAALPRVDAEKRPSWLHTWAQQFDDLAWTFFRVDDATRLAQSLPALSAEQRMDLVRLAREAVRMPRAVEYTMLDALFKGSSVLPIAAARQFETRVPEGARLPRDWQLLELPKLPRYRRWVTGVALSNDDEKELLSSLEKQICEGARVRALRSIFLRVRPTVRVPIERLDAPWMRGLLRRLAEDWSELARDGGKARTVAEVEVDIVHAAAHASLHLRGKHLRRNVLESVRKLERQQPELFDFWFTALKLLPPEGST
jgi:hypothetical protein